MMSIQAHCKSDTPARHHPMQLARRGVSVAELPSVIDPACPQSCETRGRSVSTFMLCKQW